jgi:hypothetical protein
MNLIHCIYASHAGVAIGEAEVQQLLARARSNNIANGITGMLLFIEGSFFQVLEGDAAVVDTTFEIISKDARHDRITKIIREPIAQRNFGDWSMGFAAVERSHAQRLVGENDFFASAECLERINPGRARKLLVAFRGGRWRIDETGRHLPHARVSARG